MTVCVFLPRVYSATRFWLLLLRFQMCRWRYRSTILSVCSVQESALLRTGLSTLGLVRTHLPHPTQLFPSFAITHNPIVASQLVFARDHKTFTDVRALRTSPPLSLASRTFYISPHTAHNDVFACQFFRKRHKPACEEEVARKRLGDDDVSCV